MRTKNILACAFLLIATQVVVAQNNADAIIRNLVSQIKSHKNVEMVYNYQLYSNGQSLENSEQGHAWLQGEAYKIETPEQQTLSDGKTIWSYLIDEKEVMISNASDGTDNTPLKLLTSLDKNYAATLTNIDSQGKANIELANPDGQYKRITLIIDTKKTELKSASIYLDEDNKLVIKVEEMKYDQNLDDNFFIFDTKKHPRVDIIDMR